MSYYLFLLVYSSLVFGIGHGFVSPALSQVIEKHRKAELLKQRSKD